MRGLRMVLLGLSVGLTSCVASGLDQVGDFWCPVGTTFVGDACVTAEQITVCEGVAGGGACTTSSIVVGICQAGACLEVQCGDLIVRAAEQCDDGNLVAGDGCSPLCQSEACGNGVLDAAKGEQCDPDTVPGRDHDGCSGTCDDEAIVWTQNQRLMPSARAGAAMAENSNGDIVLFGGMTETGLSNETWIRSAGVWSKLAPSSSDPPPSRDMQMIYVPNDDVGLVLIGHVGLFQWTGSGWQAFAPTHPFASSNPANGRSDFGLVYDQANRRLLVFGGRSGTDSTAQADTWVFEDGNWDLKGTSDGARRFGSAQAYVEGAGVVTFGGNRSTTDVLGDMYRWDESQGWLLIPGDSPTKRTRAMMVGDASRAILFGGYLGKADLWVWQNSSWQEIMTATSPQGRSSASMLVMRRDMSGPEILLFGGLGETGLLGDEWTLPLTDNLNGRSWTRVGDGTPERPAYAAVGYARHTDQIVAFGGILGEPKFFIAERSNDDDLPRYEWKTEPTAFLPAAGLWGATMTYDDANQRFILFGGEVSGTQYGETWELKLDGAAWAWRQLVTANGPPARRSMASYYDPQRKRIVLFGGYQHDNIAGRDVIWGDTWEFDCTTDQWVAVAPATNPPARYGHVMVWDQAALRGVLTGGNDGNSAQLATWVYERNGQDGAMTWRELDAPLPSERTYSCAVYHPLRQSIIVLTGGAQNSPSNTAVELRNGRWTTLPGNVPMAARNGASCFYDPAFASVTVLFGQLAGVLNFRDVWRMTWQAQGSAQICKPAEPDTDGDGFDAAADPDCWWTQASACPPATSCN